MSSCFLHLRTGYTLLFGSRLVAVVRRKGPVFELFLVFLGEQCFRDEGQ